jgi:hypothetical protein
MAGLFFWHISQKLDPEAVNSRFSALEYKSGKLLQQGDWNAIVFPKVAYGIPNWLVFSDGAICGTGTFAYKGKFYEKAFPEVITDMKENRLRIEEFWGCFLILAAIGKKLVLIRDGAGIARLHAFHDKPVYSSSFAGLLANSSARLTFDRDAATELLCTGVLTSSKTLIKEIKCVGIGERSGHFTTIETRPACVDEPRDREEALSQQIGITRGFFQRVKHDWSRYEPSGVLDVGITGGMDSRLAAILAIDSKAPVVLHTHWRKKGLADGDFKLAHLLAQSTGLPLHMKQVTSPIDMDEDQIKKNFEQSYCLSDGVIRPGCYWDEAYCASDYRLGLTQPPYLRILGFGGEQYRNGDRLPYASHRTLKSWIKWEMIYRFAGANFVSNEAKKRIQAQIEHNIMERMGKVNLTLPNFKEYILRIWVPSYRSLQTNMENRLGFCISPFQDTCLSMPSLAATPFLGRSLDFQLEMISRLSPEIGSIENDYGFDFTRGEPLRLKIGALCWQLVPPGIKYPFYAAAHNFNRTNYIPDLSQKHKFIQELEETVLGLVLPLDFKKYRLVRSRSRLLLNLGYFLRRNGQYIDWGISI